ncbi:MAG: MBL fold metallo-hydrolase [Thermodesulfovibrionales bacterium]|nr:MBL fold metallo-hydrolase [Thermodesulfovibrionales bacterium]
MEKDILVSPQEFKKMLDNNEVQFVFDLRNEDDFRDGKVEGRFEFETLNIPQEDFVGEEDRHFSKFPKDKQIITICAHGDSSRYTAEMLREKDFDARSLEGGIDLWTEYYETHKAATNPDIYQIYRVARGCMSYIVVSNGEAVIIDAVRHVDKIMAKIDELNVKVKYVFDTHLQADHISGGKEIADRTGASYYMNPLDAKDATFSFLPLKDGDELKFGNSLIEVIHSPGHTPGSTSLLIDSKYLFTGDLIMKTSIGRPDLGGASEEWTRLLYDTLFTRYAKLGDEVVIFPSHASSIKEQENGIVMLTMGNARKESDLFQIKDFSKFLDYVNSSLPANPERYQEIRKVNLGIINPDEKKRKELEIGKNLCGMSKG